MELKNCSQYLLNHSTLSKDMNLAHRRVQDNLFLFMEIENVKQQKVKMLTKMITFNYFILFLSKTTVINNA